MAVAGISCSVETIPKMYHSSNDETSDLFDETSDLFDETSEARWRNRHTVALMDTLDFGMYFGRTREKLKLRHDAAMMHCRCSARQFPRHFSITT